MDIIISWEQGASIIVLPPGFYLSYVFFHRHLGPPPKFPFHLCRVDDRIHTIPISLRQHGNVVRKHFGDFEDGVALGRSESILVALAFFTYHQEAAGNVDGCGKVAPLGARGDDREWLAFFVLGFEPADYRRVGTFR